MKEIQLINNQYNYHGWYFDLVRIFRRAFNSYLQYCFVTVAILRILGLIYYVHTGDDTYFVYDLTARLIYFHGNKVYDVNLLLSFGASLLCLSYLHYMVFQTQMAGYCPVFGSAFIDNHNDFMEHNSALLNRLWSWERFRHSPWATFKNFLHMLTKLWFYTSGDPSVPVVFEHPVVVFSYMTTKIRVRIWILTAIVSEICGITLIYGFGRFLLYLL